jgi:hypothetical protein
METQDPTDKRIKQLVWLYFWLLIIEGALRKWIVPSLSTPLLIVRDPVVILIYLVALSGNKFPRSAFIPWILGLGFVSVLASFSGDGNFKVTLYGLRTNFLQLPLIFLMGQVLTPDDVKKIGKWVLISSVPMALLAFQQFRSSPDARINAGVGGELGAQLFAASGKIRPAGTFSFVTGMVCYLSLVASFVLFDFLQKKQYHRLLGISAMIALGLSLGVSGSRSAVLTVSLVLAAAVLACLIKGKFFSSAVKPLLTIYLVFLCLSLLPVFREGIAVQHDRFENNGGLREGIFDRFFEDFTTSFSVAGTVPILGYGLGMGTNAGAGIMVGSRGFLLAEGEWARIVMESGPILGYAFIALRAAILIYLIRRVMNALNRGAVLPTLLFGAIGLDLVTGQFSQPTAMGFVILGSGLCLAAAREVEPTGEPVPDAPAPATPRIPGRSRYAEALHGKS